VGERRGGRALAVAGVLVVTAMLTAGCGGDDDDSAPQSGERETTTTAAPEPLQILVTNDDGVGAEGIDVLVEALRALDGVEVTVVAPADQQSGTGGSVTEGPVETNEATTASGYAAKAVDGFPADTIRVAFDELSLTPDLVVSGINEGQNLGPVVDISGTVGAARAAAQHSIPALAVSAGVGNPIDFLSAADAAVAWLHDHRDALQSSHGPPTSVSNLNVPTCAAGSVRGQVDVPADAAAPTDAAVAPADCTSTAPAGSTDVGAFHVGFATLSEVPIRPAGTSGG
jgi:5'/3'-nucleotidase